MKSKRWLSLLLMLAVILSGCGAKAEQKPDPGTLDPELSKKPLEFFGSSFHDEQGFTFDGFTLTADYEILEKRMELTETEQEPQITENEPPHNIEGMVQTVKFYQVQVEEYPEAVGEVTYIFYEKQFIGGNVSIQFPDFEEAKTFFEKADEELKEFNSAEELGTRIEENHASAAYVDNRNIHIDLKAAVTSDQKGEVTLDFSENVDRYGMMSKDSRYFDFKEKEK